MFRVFSRLFSRLRLQLMLSYLPLIAVPVLVVSLVTRSIAEQRVDNLLAEGQRAQGELFSHCLAGFYQIKGSWTGVDTVFSLSSQTADSAPVEPAVQQQPPAPAQNQYPQPRDPYRMEALLIYSANCYRQVNPVLVNATVGSGPGGNYRGGWQSHGGTNGDRRPPVPAVDNKTIEITLVGPDNTAIAGNDKSVVGKSVDALAIARGFPVFVNQTRVGTVVIDQALDQQRNQLLEVVNTALLLSGAISVALAVGIGWELSRRITRPVRDLMSGVRRLASGEWRTDEPSAELPVRAGNEIGELTRAFNGMANEITHQQRMNKQMVADIAHDLRTPLSAMALEIEAIEAGYQTPLEAADSLREEINWLQRLVDELRLLSLIDADQIKPQLAPTELTPFVCGIYDFWQTVAADARRELTVNLPAELPTIDLDPGRMRQVLGNLIDNAIRHTPAGGKIELGVSTSGKEVTLWVKDNGEGIPPDELPRVFDRFYRADRSRQHQKLGGSGLGLSIAKRLVELHGGTIAVSSTPGKGTTFTVSLPYRLS